jgi:hypothetical protein
MMTRKAKELPIWKGNPEPGIFAHISWAAESIMEQGPRLPDGSPGPCPHEGLAFVVSLHPGAWGKIARIGTEAPVVVLEFRRPALDFYRWMGKRWYVQEIPELTKWGIQNGWITQRRDFLVWHWGGEEPEKRAFRLNEEEDAKELEYYREQLELGEDADERVISIDEALGWRYSDKLRSRIAQHYSPTDTCMEAEIVNLWLQAEHPEIGMIWYAEELDVPGLSAPRGAILPAYFHEVRPIMVTTADKWGEW